LFIRPDTFARRLDFLAKGGYTVLPFGESFERLRAGTLPKNAVAITFDDGFYNNHALGLPLLKKFGIPFTIYTSS